MFRSNELRDIFIDDEDRNKFLSTFKEKSECENFSVYTYYLMDNYVHYLLSGEHEKLGKLVKRIRRRKKRTEAELQLNSILKRF